MHVTGTNPTTGETKEIEVYAGQRISTYLYNDRNVDSIMFFEEDVTERDLPEFLLERLRENPALLDKVCKETGWDKPWILGIVTPTPTPTPPPTEEKSPDKGSEEEMTPPSDEELLPEKTEDGVLTKEELAWAHSHIMFIDPGTGIFALKDTTLFDPVFYAASNPDVVAKYGTDPDALLWHYLQRGKKEGRPPIAPPTPTPTPTPVWEEPKTESQEDDDDDDEDNTSNNNGGGQNNPVSVKISGGTYNFDAQYRTDLKDSNGNDIGTLWSNIGNPFTLRANSTNGDPLEIDLTNKITMHDSVNNVDYDVTSLNQIDYGGSDVPLTVTKKVGNDTYKVVRESDPNNPGEYIESIYINNTQPAIPNDPNDPTNYNNPNHFTGQQGQTNLDTMINRFRNYGGYPNM